MESSDTKAETPEQSANGGTAEVDMEDQQASSSRNEDSPIVGRAGRMRGAFHHSHLAVATSTMDHGCDIGDFFMDLSSISEDSSLGSLDELFKRLTLNSLVEFNHDFDLNDYIERSYHKEEQHLLQHLLNPSDTTPERVRRMRPAEEGAPATFTPPPRYFPIDGTAEVGSPSTATHEAVGANSANLRAMSPVIFSSPPPRFENHVENSLESSFQLGEPQANSSLNSE